jgi:glycerol-3-phosphate O-acyltransferase
VKTPSPGPGGGVHGGEGRPLVSYEPNALLSWIYGRFFESIEIDDSWARAVREADSRGTVVYVLRNLSSVDFFALDYLTKRYHLPQIRFANDLGLWILEPMGRGWLNAMRRRTVDGDVADLERAVSGGSSAALFLKRRPQLLASGSRGRTSGDHLIRALFDVQRRSPGRVLLMPQVFVWSRSPGSGGGSLSDAVFGPAEWPGNVRSIAQFLANWRHATLRAGEPIDLAEFLDREGRSAGDDVLVRRLTYSLLRRLERERRAIVGPTRKPADRLREDVIRSPKLQKIIADMAGEGAAEREVMTARAMAMLRAMQAALDMTAIAALDQLVQQASSRMFSGVEVDQEGIERLRELAKEGTLVLLPSHKSHMDYVLLAWILYRHKLPMPVIAAGDNLNFLPVGPILRRAGAFFIRRKFSGDRLYSAVVDAYVRRLLKDGSPLEFFLEGGRSRTGKLLPPKLGLLSLVVDAALGVPTRTTWFCPISIGYERFVEEKAFVRELSGGEKQKESVRGFVRSFDALVGRYGRLSVQFGRPLSLADVLRDIDEKSQEKDLVALSPPRRRAVITRLAYRVMNEINAVTAVTAGSLVATSLLATDKRGLPHSNLVDGCQRLARMLRRRGARFSASLADGEGPDHGPGEIRTTALEEAIELFVRAGHVEAHRVGEDMIYVVPPEARLSLDLAKNVIIHFFAPRALIATALLANPGPPLALAAVRDRVLWMSRLFKYEYTFRADAPFERIFDEEIAAMEQDGEITRVVLKPSEGAMGILPKGDDGREQVKLYARLVENSIEGYRIAARGLTALQRGSLAAKDLVKRTMTLGERMFLAGDVARREAVSRPLLENAHASFVDLGYVARVDGKLGLTPSYSTSSAVATIEARIVSTTSPVA